MSRPGAPSMPTERQIQEAHKTVSKLSPGARVKRVGKEGVDFDYPEESGQMTFDKPFGADT